MLVHTSQVFAETVTYTVLVVIFLLVGEVVFLVKIPAESTHSTVYVCAHMYKFEKHHQVNSYIKISNNHAGSVHTR